MPGGDPGGVDYGVNGRSCRTPSTVMSTRSLKKLTSPWICPASRNVRLYAHATFRLSSAGGEDH
ncbi:MAG: hypothetical protein JWQ75_901 [Pseudarthrobacter sp.]|nr:hypothetical protein [Pseudarthrobacter sp.]